MNTLSKELQVEVDRREAAFLTKLTKAGLNDLAAEYNDLITVRQAAEVVSKKTRAVRNTTRDAEPPALNGNGSGNLPTPPEGFVLSDAVRDAIREINQPRFRTSQVFEILQAKFPHYITLEKKPSVSATLSNLAPGEIEKETDAQRKVWFTVVKLRGDN